MLSELAVEFGKLNQDDFQQIHYQNMGNGNTTTVPLERLRMQLLRSDEFTARAVCDVSGSLAVPATNPVPNVSLGSLSARYSDAHIGSYQLRYLRNCEAQHRSNRHNSEWLKAAMEQFKRSMDRLYGKWLGAAEVDAKTVEHILAAG